MNVYIYDANNHTAQNYVATVQEPFCIITLGTQTEARKYPLDVALRLIDQINRVSNGHWQGLRYEFAE